ncbi:MAG: dihydrofolate reductase [Deltaproteobacteria bacterium]|nr:dihydrofolate reductase [Deltaproteobacteria bacterium]MBW2385129.1 dihydrofolate reductase [Deltaproteobacteria bacterium]MBW2695632.1 dihydrofolate reductase [Deltaproteobacteria bacterium]
MRVSIVVAAAENGVIGAGGGIPWRLPDDQRLFKRLTSGHTVVMGRGTHESIGRLLPGRTTIVVSRNPDYSVAQAFVADSLEAALDLARARGESETFVVGGGSLYALALPLANGLYLTRVHAEVEGDVTFPDPAAAPGAGWKLEEEQEHAADEHHAQAFTFQRWERTGDCAGRSAARTLSALLD